MRVSMFSICNNYIECVKFHINLTNVVLKMCTQFQEICEIEIDY